MIGEQDKQGIIKASRAMSRATLDARTDRLDTLLDDGYSLTHMTGYRQPKREWLSAIDSGQIRYHGAEEQSVDVDVDVRGDSAVLIGRSVVTATIHGARDLEPPAHGGLRAAERKLDRDAHRRDHRWTRARGGPALLRDDPPAPAHGSQAQRGVASRRVGSGRRIRRS